MAAVVCGRGLAGEVVAAVEQHAFVPGLLPRSAGAGSGAGGEFSGCVYRSGPCPAVMCRRSLMLPVVCLLWSGSVEGGWRLRLLLWR